MITRSELHDISRRRDGKLSDVPFPVLLHALSLHERTVVLEITRHRLSKRIVFEFGDPVDCQSNLVHERLGTYLVRQGKISDEDFRSCFSEALGRDLPLGEIFIQKKLITPYELFKVLQQNLAKKLLDGFTWSDGEFRMLFDVPRVQSPLRVKVPQLVVTGITRFSPQEEVESGVAPLVGRRLVCHPSPEVSLRDLKLTTTQQRIAHALDGGGRIDEIVHTTRLPSDEVSRLLYALSVLGVVVSDDVAAAARSAPERNGGADRASAPHAASPEESVDLRNEIMAAYLAHRREDPFDFLGVSEEASTTAIQNAFLERAERWSPWSFRGTPLESLTDKATDLFLAASRAYAQLADTQERQTLLFRRRTLREEKERARKAGPAPIKTDLLDPEEQFKKGKRLMDSGNHRQALQYIEFASDCDPQNGRYRAELAYCRFLHSPARAEEALDHLKETMRIDPQCGLALYYRGEILCELGRLEEAEECLKKSIKLMSPDRRPIEALKSMSGQLRKRRS